MVVFGKSGFIRANVDVFRQMWKYSSKVVVFGQKWLNLGKSGCIPAKMVLFGNKWFYSAKRFYSVKSGCYRAKWLYSLTISCTWARGCIWSRRLYLGKVALFVQSDYILAR